MALRKPSEWGLIDGDPDKNYCHLSYYMKVGDRMVGRAQLERLSDTHATPHFTIYDERNHRRGMGTFMLDAMLAYAKDNALEIVWIDDPRYKPMDGRGYFSSDGKAFADVYRTRHNIAIPAVTHVA